MYSTTAHDVIDFVRTADTDRDGNISYKEFIEILQAPDAIESKKAVATTYSSLWLPHRCSACCLAVQRPKQQNLMMTKSRCSLLVCDLVHTVRQNPPHVLKILLRPCSHARSEAQT